MVYSIVYRLVCIRQWNGETIMLGANISTEVKVKRGSIWLHGEAQLLEDALIETIERINWNYKNGTVTDVWYLWGYNRGSVHVKYTYGSAMYSFRVDGNTVLFRGVRRTVGYKYR